MTTLGPYRTPAPPPLKSKWHLALYAIALPWDLFVCWPAVLIIRVLWGTNLRWERNPDPESGDGPSLWCDLKSDS